RGQAEVLVPMVQEVVAQAGCGFDAIDLVVATRGPGAFTGLRIGLSTAKSTALALDVPVAGVSTLEVLARQYLEGHSLKDRQKCAVIAETKREDFYFQIFDGQGVAVSQPCVATAAEIMEQIGTGPIVAVGDGIKRFSVLHVPENIVFHEISLPDPAVLARLGLEQYKAEGGGGRQHNIEPLYLRAPDVSQPKTLPRVLMNK
ncbi:MAG TPA: tRNA (adenosine(37)-N6)-threonylcarbamoyltransferase complex dimerization subunit type 1 TsaB, partial [Rhodospirillaceae bacterium]|nr:tRNA (adenosine(37)-N6)-threonylcarbamoyltransferase complex dimerization subunit type 1 TsaB [Rhodospirillaceae bacterium]